MNSIVHEFDPEGDVVLILRNFNIPFAIWPGSPEPPAAPACNSSDAQFLTWASGLTERTRKGRGLPSFKSLDPGDAPGSPHEDPPLEEPLYDDAIPEDAVLDAAPIDASITEDEEPIPVPIELPEEVSEEVPEEVPAEVPGEVPEEVPAEVPGEAPAEVPEEVPKGVPEEQQVEMRMRLSSQHLILASTYFRKALQSPWKVSGTSCDPCNINESEWDAEAMLILMIIHGRNRSVPEIINLEMLARLAVLVDYYDCHEVVEFWVTKSWVKELGAIPNEYCRDLLLWLVVSWVFSLETQFEIVTAVALKESDEPIQNLGLPIPPRIFDTIEQMRQELREQMTYGLQNLVSYFHQRNNCSIECSSILIGALVKQMRSNRLLDPKPSRPYLGHSVARTTATIRNFASPRWSDTRASRSFGRSSCEVHPCTLAAFMDPTVNSLADGVTGLKLKDFRC